MKYKLLVGVLIALNLALAGYVAKRRFSANTNTLISVAESNVLPRIVLRDENGREFNTSIFLGSPLFVQFINPYVEAQIDSLLHTRSNSPQTAVSWLLITTDAEHLRSRLPTPSRDVFIVERNYKELRELFSIPGCCEYWVIFDEEGNFRDTGRYDTGKAVSSLRHIADDTPEYSVEALADALRTIDSNGLMADFHARAKRAASGRLIVGLFSTACTGCGDGLVIEMLNRASQQDHRNSYLIVLPSTFKKTELTNFKINLGLTLPVELAHKDFTEHWHQLNQRYGENEINGTVLVVDKVKLVSVVSGLFTTKELLKEVQGLK